MIIIFGVPKVVVLQAWCGWDGLLQMQQKERNVTKVVERSYFMMLGLVFRLAFMHANKWHGIILFSVRSDYETHKSSYDCSLWLASNDASMASIDNTCTSILPSYSCCLHTSSFAPQHQHHHCQCICCQYCHHRHHHISVVIDTCKDSV